MWCPEGFVTADELNSTFTFDTDLAGVASNVPGDPNCNFHIQTGLMDGSEVQGFINWLWSTLFDRLGNDLRVCLESGQVVRLAPSVFSYIDDPELTFHDFNDYSGSFPRHYESRAFLAKRDFTCIDVNMGCVKSSHLGPKDPLFQLDRMPLCIHESAIPVKWFEITSWLMEEADRIFQKRLEGGPEVQEIRTLAQRIVEAYRSGKVTRRAEAERLFRGNLNTDSWRAVWKEAGAIMPSISRPGPR